MFEEEYEELSEDEKIRMFISGNLKKIRQEKNLSMMEVSARAGISRQVIGMYEHGKRFPSLTILIKLSNAYGITLENLIGYDEIQRYMAQKRC